MNGRTMMLACTIGGIMTATAGAEELRVPKQYPTIQAAIDAAETGDTVIVAEGVYTGEGNRDISFLGKAITVRSASGPAACVLDCEGSQEDPHRGFSFESGETSASRLEGFTIRNGSTPSGAIADQFNGAGILTTGGSSPTIVGCRLIGNWAGCWGGAICASFESDPLIIDCEITGNYSDDDGGGVFAWAQSHPTLVNCVISNNESRITGGGVTSFSGMTLVNCTLVANQAVSGSGLYGWNAEVTNSVLWNNHGDVQIQGMPTVTYSLVAGGYEGEGNLDVDPMFTAEDDLRPVSDSPLINAGDPDFTADLAGTDFDGNPRIWCGRVDIGAYEHRGVRGMADLLREPCAPARPTRGPAVN